MTPAPGSTHVLGRPQPLGLFDGPAGLLLLRGEAEFTDLLVRLSRGEIPDGLTEGQPVLAAALGDDFESALSLLGTGPEDAVNRLVLAPSPESLDAAVAAAGSDPRMNAVVAAAAFASGLSDEPPSAHGLDGEFAVLALTVRAARALEFKDSRAALRLLDEAIPHAQTTGPVLHARVLGMAAEQRARNRAAQREAADTYGRAVALLEGTAFSQLRAGYQLERAVLLHQMAGESRHLLVEAVRGYQSALLVLDEKEDPERFALASMNLGIAILAMPMTQASDQVRLGVAVQSLRAALRVYNPDTHPYEWSSCQMNLANALQYLPSTHGADNLREAVDLYEAVLGVRSRLSDPAGYARVLANQANALAHLAVFDEAATRYQDARGLFVAVGDHDAVEVIDRQLAEIESCR